MRLSSPKRRGPKPMTRGEIAIWSIYGCLFTAAIVLILISLKDFAACVFFGLIWLFALVLPVSLRLLQHRRLKLHLAEVSALEAEVRSLRAAQAEAEAAYREIPPSPVPPPDQAVFCPRCGARNSADSRYCANCGQEIPAFSGAVPVEIELMRADMLDGLAFERWCADLLERSGFSPVSVTQGSGDQGVDVLAEKDGVRYAVQCKCYSSDLGNGPIQEVNAGKLIYHCHIGAVMTNRHFTAGAKEAAAATGTLLWDREHLRDLLCALGHPTAQELELRS